VSRSRPLPTFDLARLIDGKKETRKGMKGDALSPRAFPGRGIVEGKEGKEGDLRVSAIVQLLVYRSRYTTTTRGEGKGGEEYKRRAQLPTL